jgi:NAD(P)H-flavin reductase
MRDRIAHREAALTSIYVGVRTAKDIPLADEVAGWAHAGAQLVLCLSRIAEDDGALLAGVPRADGYVQRIVAADLATKKLAIELVFAAGPAGMLADLQAQAHAALEVHANA